MNLAIILIISLLCLTNKVKAEEWILNTYQYADGYTQSTDTTQRYTSDIWGTYGISGYRGIYKFGAYVNNPLCETDYCILFNDTYLLTATLTSTSWWYTDEQIRERFDKTKIHVNMGYINSNGSRTYKSLYNEDISSLFIKRINDQQIQISFLFTTPSRPSNMLTYEWTYVDFWFDSGNKDFLTYSTSQYGFGFTSVTIKQATSEVIENYQADISNYFNQLKEQEQNQTIINQNSQQIQQDKEQHDELMNSDIPNKDKELPDDSKYQDYNNTENDLKDKVNQADMSVISIGIDSNSSVFVWDTLTRIIQSNSIVFGMFIAILSIGIIKLALGR